MAWIVKGDGTAEFRGEHSCRVEFQLENTATGEIKRERKTMRVESKTRKEKNRCIREFRAELESGVNRDFSKMTFREYADEWLRSRKADPQLAAGTVMRDENRLANINLHLGDMLLTEITKADIRRFQTALMTAGEDGTALTVSGRPLPCSQTTTGTSESVPWLTVPFVTNRLLASCQLTCCIVESYSALIQSAERIPFE